MNENLLWFRKKKWLLKRDFREKKMEALLLLENSSQVSVWIEQEWSIRTGTVIQDENTGTVFALKIGIEN